jgi:hypothetical protein
LSCRRWWPAGASATALALSIIVSAGLASAAPKGFNFADFSSIKGLNLVGTAKQQGTELQLTPAKEQQVGAAWYATPQAVGNGFTTTFTFQFTNESSPPADGIAFLIQNEKSKALGLPGGAIGYQGIHNSLAVEFDTFDNSGADPNANHIAVQSCGSEPNGDLTACQLGITSSIGQIADGNVHTVTISYTPGILLVFFDDLSTPALAVKVNLSKLLKLAAGGKAWVGFTGSTGTFFETQDLLSWSFTPGASLVSLKIKGAESAPSVGACTATGYAAHCPSGECECILIPGAALSGTSTGTASVLMTVDQGLALPSTLLEGGCQPIFAIVEVAAPSLTGTLNLFLVQCGASGGLQVVGGWGTPVAIDGQVGGGSAGGQISGGAATLDLSGQLTK